MKQPLLRIAIIGCGTAGPAAAVLLKRLGHEIVLFQSDHEWLTPIRRAFFGLAGKIPWARWLMTLSMAGLVDLEGRFAKRR